MQPFLNASGGPAFVALVNSLYDIPHVHGFCLDVDPVYVSLVYGQQPWKKLNEALEFGFIPAGWPEHCGARKLAANASPIRVVIYIKGDPTAFRSAQQIPISIAPGHEVLIEERGPFVGAADYSMHRPLVGGICVGNSGRNDDGTLGGFLKQQGTRDPELLSCHHVLVHSSAVDVLQRSKNHGGSALTEKVGTVSHVVPLKAATGFSYSSPYNKVDACLAKVDTSVAAVNGAIRLVTTMPTGTAPTASISLGDAIHFVGKESDRRDAHIVRFISRQKVLIDGNLYNFGDFFEIKSPLPISLAVKGDSGSWVLRNVASQASELCGLLFAIDSSVPDRAFCCFIESVINDLNTVSGATYELY